MTTKGPLSKERPMRHLRDDERAGRVVVENVNHPGKTHSLDAAHYQAMRLALLRVSGQDSGSDARRSVRCHSGSSPGRAVPGWCHGRLVAEGGAARPRSEGNDLAGENDAVAIAPLVTGGFDRYARRRQWA